MDRPREGDHMTGHATNLQKLIDLHGHDPWHCQMLKYNNGKDGIKLLIIEVGTQSVCIANNIRASSP